MLHVYQISLKSVHKNVSYARFSIWCEEEEEEEEKYEETKSNFGGAYLANAWADSAQIWNRTCPAPRKFAQQNSLVSAKGVSSYRCTKTAFTCVE